jgi:aspartyl protease family protein
MKIQIRCITISILLSMIIVQVNAQTVIPMEKKNGVYVIPCYVNDLKLEFIFDTGAGDVSISLTEAIFMIKNGYIKEEDIQGSEKYRIANGEITEGTKIIIRKLQIGNKTLYNVKASIVHTSSAPLLLGQSAIERFGTFTVDYSTNNLIIGKSGEMPKNETVVQTEVKPSVQPVSLEPKPQPNIVKYRYYADIYDRSSGIESKEAEVDAIKAFMTNGLSDDFLIAEDKVPTGYYLICGSFSKKENAENCVDQLKLLPRATPILLRNTKTGVYYVAEGYYKNKAKTLVDDLFRLHTNGYPRATIKTKLRL